MASQPYRYGSLHGPIGVDGLPLAVDWRKFGVVSSVDDQFDTRSCWAHAAAGAVESLNAIQTGVLVKLSVQQLRECCNITNVMYGGGNVANAFDYIYANGGLVPAQVYSFQEEINALYKHIECDAVTLDDCYYNDEGNEFILKKLVANSPVCTSIAADAYFDQSKDKVLYGRHYDLDVFEELGLGHYILVIGYDVLFGVPVWLIKNSWSTKWGDLGFRYIVRNAGSFGIGQEISVPFKISPNLRCKVRSEHDIGLGKRWWLSTEDWPRYYVDVGQIKMT